MAPVGQKKAEKPLRRKTRAKALRSNDTVKVWQKKAKKPPRKKGPPTNPVIFNLPIYDHVENGGILKSPAQFVIRSNGRWIFQGTSCKNVNVVLGNPPYPNVRFWIIVNYNDVNGVALYQASYNVDQEGYKGETRNVYRTGLDTQFIHNLLDMGTQAQQGYHVYIERYY
jgi:hypothetical protein